MIDPPKSEPWRPIPRIKQAIASLHPAYFALTMATGIVSIACHLLRFRGLGYGLLCLNVVAFVVLLGMNAARIVLFPRRVLADLVDHKRGVGFLTLVAACCILGSQFLLIADARFVAVALWEVGIVLWFALTYIIFASLAVQQTKPSLADGIHGGWLALVVCTQSVSVLGSLLAAGFGRHAEHAIFYSLGMWLVGGMLYIWIISLIFYRYWFFPMSPADLSAAQWINMGAMAISTLAGTSLIAIAAESAILAPLLPFLKGLTLFFWATATWWIPLVVILGIWRHAMSRFRFAYNPLAWEAVFPLGTYAACTQKLAETLNLPFLFVVSEWFVYLALIVWTLTFTGMIYSITVGRGTNDCHRAPRG